MTHKDLVNRCKNVDGTYSFEYYKKLRWMNPKVQPPKKSEPRRFLTDRERVARDRRPTHW